MNNEKNTHTQYIYIYVYTYIFNYIHSYEYVCVYIYIYICTLPQPIVKKWRLTICLGTPADQVYSLF